MSDYDTPPRFVWLTEGGSLSHHKPDDPTAVRYDRTDTWRDEVERLRADLDDCKRGLVRCWADNAQLSDDLAAARARLLQTQRILWDDEGDDLGCATSWEQALLRTRTALATLPTTPEQERRPDPNAIHDYDEYPWTGDDIHDYD